MFRHSCAVPHGIRTSLPGWAILAALLPQGAVAAEPQSGKAVVETRCVVCHGTGLDGAPRIGDAKAWDKRTRQGLTSLTEHALEGIRQMPPHGGKLALSDLEIQRAIIYMVNRSGGHWAEPLDRSQPAAKRSGESIVKARCSQCHASGVGGAPRIGDDKAWVGRARDGFDSLVQSAIRGHGPMPARGGMAELTDAEMRDAVTYMFQSSTNPKEK
jgi:cytochrome c5